VFKSVADGQTIVDPEEAAESARLKQVSPLAVPSCRPYTKPYDRAELIADAILHTAGLGLAVTGLFLLISMAGGLPGLQGTSVWIYGVGLVTLVATSMVYNAWPLGSTKLLLRRFDQSAIYLFIAATYTPIIARTDMVSNRIFLVVIWTVACVGLALKLAFPCRFERLAILLCLAMGASGLLVYDVVFSPLAPAAVCLIAVGGVLYSIGIVFHLWDNLRFQNAIWHAFVLSAAALQFMAVLDLVSEAVAATG
jgi:hemolysin III